MKKLAVSATVMAMAATPVLAQDAAKGPGKSNFTYSALGIQLGRITLDEEIVFLDEVYEDFGAASLSGAVQLADNFAIGGFSSAYANEGSRTELNSSSVGINVYFPIPLAERIDLVPRLGFIRTEVEACVDGFCATDDDSAVTYGLASRVWAVPEQVELNVGVSDTNADDSESTFSLGGAIWGNENHRFALDYEASDSADAVFLGYSYNW